MDETIRKLTPSATRALQCTCILRVDTPCLTTDNPFAKPRYGRLQHNAITSRSANTEVSGPQPPSHCVGSSQRDLRSIGANSVYNPYSFRALARTNLPGSPVPTAGGGGCSSTGVAGAGAGVKGPRFTSSRNMSYSRSTSGSTKGPGRIRG